MNRTVKALETSLLCLMAKCKNHFLFMFHFRTIKFVINASGHVTWKKEHFLLLSQWDHWKGVDFTFFELY